MSLSRAVRFNANYPEKNLLCRLVTADSESLKRFDIVSGPGSHVVQFRLVGYLLSDKVTGDEVASRSMDYSPNTKDCRYGRISYAHRMG